MCIWYRGIAELRRKCQNDSLILLYHWITYNPSRCSTHEKKKTHNIQLQRKFGCHSLEDEQWNWKKRSSVCQAIATVACKSKHSILYLHKKEILKEIGPSFHLRVCISQVYEKLYKEKRKMRIHVCKIKFQKRKRYLIETRIVRTLLYFWIFILISRADSHYRVDIPPG